MAARRIEAEVCVIGSGISGALCALRLAETFERVVILEKGVRSWGAAEAYRRSVAEGRDPALCYPETRLSRAYFVNKGDAVPYQYMRSLVGGATAAWWGSASRLLPADFRMKSLYGVGLDWPIGYDELEPYYCEAEHEMSIAGDRDASPWPQSRPYAQPAHPLSPHERLIAEHMRAQGLEVVPMPTARLSRAAGDRPPCCGTGTCSACPVDAKYTCANTHIPRVERTPSIELIAGVRANLLLAREDRIEAALAQNERAEEIVVTAKVFVLAANALENVRILLNSALHADSFRANRHTGRNFHEHPALEVRGQSKRDLARGRGPTPMAGVMRNFADGPFRAERAAYEVATYNPPPTRSELLTPLLGGLREGKSGAPLIDAGRREWQGRFWLNCQLDQLPDPDSVVRLSSTQRDPYGWPIIETDVHCWTDYVRRGAEHWRAIAVKIAKDLDADVVVKPVPTWVHYLGTHLMGTSAANSVIDADHRYHDYRNLFLLGQGVMPTGGVASPTVTLAALSLRAAKGIVRLRSSY